ncbi:MAG: hypothetical protein IPM68_03575 [Flavobacteriales bacterium]|nr:hypothetical protein [Flavobacteriales bacterium]
MEAGLWLPFHIAHERGLAHAARGGHEQVLAGGHMLPELADQARAAQVAIALSYGPYDGIEADHDDNGPVGKHINNVVIVKQLDNIVIVRRARTNREPPSEEQRRPRCDDRRAQPNRR